MQPHAGASANLAAYQALLEPGDTVLAMRLDQGGHLTHGSPASITSKIWRFVAYGVSPATGDPDKPGEIIDFDQVADIARREHPALIVAGSTAYSRIIDPLPFREIADSVGARFMYDAAHPAGLIAGGVHPSPVGIADVVTLTTHKTLRGPRGGAIMTGAELAQEHRQRGLPRAPGRPPRARHRGEGGRVRRGRSTRVRASTRQRWSPTPGCWPTRSPRRGSAWFREAPTTTRSSIDLRDFDPELTGKVAQETLDRAGITCNRNTIPDDPRSPFVTSGLRLGTAAETTAGMGDAEMRLVGALIGRTLRHRDDEGELVAIRKEVRALCSGFPPYAALTGG